MARGDLIVGKIPGRKNPHLCLDRGAEGMQVIARFLSEEAEEEFVTWVREHSKIKLEDERA